MHSMPLTENNDSEQHYLQSMHTATELLSLCEAFTSVQEPKQLEYLLRLQVHPLLGIHTSYVTCIKESNNGDEYLLHTPPAEITREQKEYYILQKEKDALLLGLLNRINEQERYIRLDWNRQAEEIQADTALRAFPNAGTAALLIAGLFRRSKVIGYWLMLVPEHLSKAALPSRLLDLVTLQLSNAVHKIILYEQLHSNKKESESLQLLNIDLAAARNRQDILSLVRTRLLALFPFSHHFICKVNEDDTTLSLYGTDVHSCAQYHPLYETVKAMKVPIADGIWNKVLLSSEPAVFDLTEMEKRETLPMYLRVNAESGIRWVVMLAFKLDEKVIGAWAIAFTHTQQPLSRQLKLIKAIAAPVSVAISNIIANESLHEKREERERLLDANFALADVRDRQKLEEALHLHLPLLLRNSYHSVALVQESKANTEIDIIRIEHLFHTSANNTQLTALHNEGVQWIAVLSLKNGNEPAACLHVYFKGVEKPEKKLLNLLKEISLPASKAFSAILHYEEIVRRDKEKELLLTLSKDIAGIREKEQLLQTIKKRLQQPMGFTHFALAVKDAAGVITTFLADPGSRAKMHPSYYSLFRQELQHDHPFLQHIHQASQPVVINRNNAVAFSELPDVIKVNFESGIEEMVITRLYDGINVFGYWFLFFQERGQILSAQFNLVSAISHQLSTAMLNIRANTELINRDRENELLLNISKMISGAKNYGDVTALIAAKLPEVFLFEHHLIGIIQERDAMIQFVLPPSPTPGITYSEHTYTLSDLLGEETGESLLTSDSFIEITLTSKQIIRFQQITGERIPAQAMVTSFTYSGKLTGIWLLFYTNTPAVSDKKSRLLSSIKDQLSVAIGNLQASEQIQRQLTETSHYKEHLEEEKIYLREELETAYQYADIVGQSNAVKKVFEMVALVAPSDSTVLIQGETGTGKELIARAIHHLSPRQSKLMVKVNCAALPANLVESELFGHEKGSFTGAIERRIGKFELANGGTLFLDEIGEMPLELQVKLLRALQEREIERIGGRSVIKVNVRVVTATNRNLEQEVREGRFRSDLYFRLNTFPIYAPPLREHKEDIPLLANHFVNRFSKKAGKAIDTISQGALQTLMAYDWPGNVRELEHHVERSVLLAQGNTIRQMDVMLRQAFPAAATQGDSSAIKTIDDNERDLIIRALKFCSGKISGTNGAASLLGVPPTTLYSKMKRLHIKKTFNK
ncbi:Transcriptional regulator containing GAF, AAA-type ATPase, and DNA-binding Fis domains [Filimonas lacunae]|uniref:Transcriptional regulator containing GAF, AAA-type ATPase, and DNA-binding Fis domains n=2 Tax=Filimonas lacunae TaxID=477680 RepID=A0A1N7NGU9_9BACT|nr:Transcriptional regulator containing GAF, AAA-type ATPase, and DNA-binding Fis domains [Filimonas lacunae]